MFISAQHLLFFQFSFENLMSVLLIFLYNKCIFHKLNRHYVQTNVGKVLALFSRSVTVINSYLYHVLFILKLPKCQQRHTIDYLLCVLFLTALTIQYSLFLRFYLNRQTVLTKHDCCL